VGSRSLGDYYIDFMDIRYDIALNLAFEGKPVINYENYCNEIKL